MLENGVMEMTNILSFETIKHMTYGNNNRKFIISITELEIKTNGLKSNNIPNLGTWASSMKRLNLPTSKSIMASSQMADNRSLYTVFNGSLLNKP